MKAIILLGGKGTRLLPLTINKPKPLITFFNRPFITYQIELLKQYGVNEIILSLGHFSKQIKDFIKSRKDRSISIKYVEEKEPLGTAGAIKNAQPLIKDGPFLVLNGDIFTDLNLGKFISFHKNRKSILTICLAAVDNPSQYGLIKLDNKNRVKTFLEKPTYVEAEGCRTINAGIYIFDPEVLSYIPAGRKFSAERELFPLLLNNGKKVFGYKENDYWMDIGTIEKYKQAHRDILEGKIKFSFLSLKKKNNGILIENKASISKQAIFKGPLFIGEKCRILDGSWIGPFSIIGNDCMIESGATIEDSIILDGAKIGKNTRIKSCIIGQNCKIGENSFISEGVTLGDGCSIAPHSRL